MAINFQQVMERIREIGLGARQRRENLDSLRQKAETILGEWAARGDELNEKLDHALRCDSTLRCAIPLSDPLNARFQAELTHDTVTLIAADGSQVAPDRHAAVLFSLVNVGAIVMQPGSDKAPFIQTDSRLLVDDENYTETGMLTLEAIEQRRDLAERRKLLELAKDVPGGIIALTDGPLELWGGSNSARDEYLRDLEIHKSTLSQLQERGAVVAGYVDKPGASLVLRLLEITQLSTEDEFEHFRRQHPLRGVTDLWLYGKLLEPGQRSAVFGLQSSSRLHYTGGLALHFFYLNVGSQGHPALVRVEIPKWVADDIKQLNMLHAILLEQCQIMGARPYPYILHRAHEIAVVKMDEKNQVEAMLQRELRHIRWRSGRSVIQIFRQVIAREGKKVNTRLTEQSPSWQGMIASAAVDSASQRQGMETMAQ